MSSADGGAAPKSSSTQPIAAGSIAAILPAGGSGSRFGAEQNKLFTLLAGKPIWFHSAAALRARPEVGRIVMPVAAADRLVLETEAAASIAELGLELVAGGNERTDSVAAGLAAIGDHSKVEYIAVHDAARPLVRDDDLSRVFAAVVENGAAILAAPVPGTVKRASDALAACETVDRRELWIALTPQVFQAALLHRAYRQHNGRPATDDAELVERLGHAVTLVPGSTDNLKITYPEDLAVAAAILTRRSSP